MKLTLCALDENGPMSRGHGHAADVGIQKALLAVGPDLTVFLGGRGLLFLALRVRPPGEGVLGSGCPVVVQACQRLGQPVGRVGERGVLFALQVQGVEGAAEHARGCAVGGEHRRRRVMAPIFIVYVRIAQIGG